MQTSHYQHPAGRRGRPRYVSARARQTARSLARHRALPHARPQCARARMQGGGVRLNNGKVNDEVYVVQEGDLIEGRLLLIAAGKKNKMLVRVAAA